MLIAKADRRVSMGFTAVTAVFVVLVFLAVLFATQISITPIDTIIIQVLEENEARLLRIEGVVGASIARDEQNLVIGIAVYVQEEAVDPQLLPTELDGHTIHVKPWGEATGVEKEGMILHSTEVAPSRP
ncbi:hypothetical protein AC480_02355, partial [miscellaneous Crenarchaeota group archaeon SMTZ1-55]